MPSTDAPVLSVRGKGANSPVVVSTSIGAPSTSMLVTSPLTAPSVQLWSTTFTARACARRRCRACASCRSFIPSYRSKPVSPLWGAGDYPLVTRHMHRVHAYQHRAVLPALVLVPRMLPLAAARRPEIACHRCPIPFDAYQRPSSACRASHTCSRRRRCFRAVAVEQATAVATSARVPFRRV